MTKTYETIYAFTLHTGVMVNGKRIKVDFVGGQKPFYNGRFMTDNEGIQKALENNPRFNKDWKLIFGGKQVVKKVEEEKKDFEIVDLDVPQYEPEDLIEDQIEETIIAEDVKNAQQAKNFIVKKFKVSMNSVRNVPLIEKFAKENKIEFPNWNR